MRKMRQLLPTKESPMRRILTVTSLSSVLPTSWHKQLKMRRRRYSLPVIFLALVQAATHLTSSLLRCRNYASLMKIIQIVFNFSSTVVAGTERIWDGGARGVPAAHCIKPWKQRKQHGKKVMHLCHQMKRSMSPCRRCVCTTRHQRALRG